MIKRFVANLSKQKEERDRLNEYRDLIRSEATLGGQLFGDLPEGHRREFFCLDTHTWIWHEEWTDMLGRRNIRTTRYDVRPDGILKAQDGAGYYQSVSADEARNLIAAAKMYRTKVLTDLYHVSAVN